MGMSDWAQFLSCQYHLQARGIWNCSDREQFTGTNNDVTLHELKRESVDSVTGNGIWAGEIKCDKTAHSRIKRPRS